MLIDQAFIANLSASDEYFQDVGGNVFLMDNHKWAILAWEQRRQLVGSAVRFALAHADYHWDDGENFMGHVDLPSLRDYGIERIADLIHASKPKNDGELPSPRIAYDSFILPAVARGYIAEAHFYCRQGDRDEDNKVIPEKIAGFGKCTTTIHANPESFAKVAHRPVIFDLCLDLFCSDAAKVGESAIDWSDQDVTEFLTCCQPLIREAELVTVSLSFGYSGTADETRHLAGIVLPFVLAARST